MSASGNCAMYGTGLRTLPARARGVSAAPKLPVPHYRHFCDSHNRGTPGSASGAALLPLPSLRCWAGPHARTGVLVLAGAGTATQRREHCKAHHTASTSVMRMSKPMTVNSSISAIFSRPCGAARRASAQGTNAPLSGVL
jgi:hypothetical protein